MICPGSLSGDIALVDGLRFLSTLVIPVNYWFDEKEMQDYDYACAQNDIIEIWDSKVIRRHLRICFHYVLVESKDEVSDSEVVLQFHFAEESFKSRVVGIHLLKLVDTVTIDH